MRAAIKYLRGKKGDADKIAPSLYDSHGKRKKKGGQGQFRPGRITESDRSRDSTEGDGAGEQCAGERRYTRFRSLGLGNLVKKRCKSRTAQNDGDKGGCKQRAVNGRVGTGLPGHTGVEPATFGLGWPTISSSMLDDALADFSAR